jgi:Phage tail tube protein
MDVLKNGRDTISGNEGSVVATIGGDVHTLFYVKEFEATVELEKEEVKFLGSRATHHKVIGWNGSGSMTIHYITSKYRKLIANYIKGGNLPAMTFVGTNADPGSSVGSQTVALKGVILDGVDVFHLDNESVLEESIDFTFEDMDLLNEFGQPIT